MPAHERTSLALAGLAITLCTLAGCSREASPPRAEPATTAGSRASGPDRAGEDTPSPAAAADPGSMPESASGSDDAARTSRYLDIADCPVVIAKPDEAGYRVTECPAPAGYALRVSEADGRLNLLVRRPGAGDFTSLRLPERAGGAFSRLGARVEWRGRGEGGAFAPDVLVARYITAPDPSDPARETQHLVVARLAAPGPCVIAFVPPGATQSDDARAAADATAPCR